MKVFAVIFTTLALVVGFAVAAEVAGTGMSCGKHEAGCCAKNANIERTVEKIADGVRITMSAKDAKDIAKIQECAEKCGQNESGSCPMHGKNVTRKVEKTAMGVIITATATDAEVVKALQAHAEKMKAGGCKHGDEKAMMKSGCAYGSEAEMKAACNHGEEKTMKNCAKGQEAKQEAKKECCAKDANIERTVEKIADGVRITMSAKDAKIITSIQECAEKSGKNETCSCPMHGKNVTRKVEKTATGVIITATATDSETVKALQAHAEKMKAGGCKHGDEKAMMKSGCAHGSEAEMKAACNHGEEKAMKNCCAKGEAEKKN